MCDSTVLSPSEHEEDLGIWERQSVGAAPTMDRMSHSDATPSAQSSPGNSRSNQEPLHGVTEATLPSDQGRGSAENMEKVAADSTRPWLKFCAALERPADKVRNVKKLSIRDKIRLRRSTTTNMDHVLLMGTVSFVLDPLACPYAEEEACKKFFATSPSFLKAHLQNKHDLKNVLLNFVCPCPAKCNARKECATVLFDPSHMNSHMTAHLERRHRKYYEAMCVALLSAEPLPGEDPEKVKTRLYYRERARRFTFPAWTREKDKMFPSQIIPDRIIIPTEIHRRGDGVIKYICNIDPCSDSHTAIGDGGPQAAFNMHVHMLLEHGKRYGLTSTRFYHKCPACGELINAADNQLETHVKALHEELLLGGHRGEFSEDAQKLKALEDSILSPRIGGAITNGRQPDDDRPGSGSLFLQRFTCPVRPCDKEFLGDGKEREYMLWHIRADHRDAWNVPATETAVTREAEVCTLNLPDWRRV
ncbi:uncharacterized protein LOC129587236 isoform X2 [Paramacrobiotus metropolitanus]|uniref:uncharacterized protein LOC129587236 isoform X2 n=1 Tax=Paramacrobiotus metropolitanus TaxID=2943436 RepID=UPI00244657B6|nr:uncharacterized protein LOC129587236 isoform X2 [Paramacrobiotus metropolitanus]